MRDRLKRINKKRKPFNLLKEAEVGVCKKNSICLLRVALVYPNYYHVGMANLGFHKVYMLANSVEGVSCERAFLTDANDKYGSKNVLTIESRTPIKQFDIIAFSISFENDVLSVLNILDRAGLPLLSSQRNYEYPIVLVGGALSFLNPEPLAPFVDCFLIGEAEVMLREFFLYFGKIKKNKEGLVDMVCQIPSLYVPAFFRPRYTELGTINDFTPIEKIPKTVACSILNNIVGNPTNTEVFTSNTVFKDTFLIEVSRGCSHGCRFCTSGYVCGPVRFQSKEVIEKQIAVGLKLTKKIGLVGAAISDHSDIESICSMSKWVGTHFTFSSLRADNVNGRIIKMLEENNVKTATIAPDSGSERLRKVINKGITEEDILNAVKSLVVGNIPNLKLYFMVGLPTETFEDVKEIIFLCQKIGKCFVQSSKSKGRVGQITVSLNPFIPKPFTPFQWAAMDKFHVLKKKIGFVSQGLNKIPNIIVQRESLRLAYIQALIARGDRKVAEILMLVHENNNNWPKSLKTLDIDTDFYVNRVREVDEIFPWDFLKQHVDKSFLLSEYKLALLHQESSPCYNRKEECSLCNFCG